MAQVGLSRYIHPHSDDLMIDRAGNLLVKGGQVITSSGVLDPTTSGTGGAGVVNFNTSDDINTLQAVHDALKAIGGGTIRFACPAGTVYSPTTNIAWDTSYVGFQFGEAKFDVSGITANTYYITASASAIGKHGPSPGTAWWRRMQGGWFYSGFTANQGVDGTVGNDPTLSTHAIRFDSNNANSVNAVVMDGVRIEECGIALSVKSRSYFLRVLNSTIKFNGIGVQGETGASTFAEKIVFETCAIGNNDTQIGDNGGNIWTFYGCSIDYHYKRMFSLAGGASITLQDCHLEWSYGNTAGMTNPPVWMFSANTRFIMRGGRISYQGGSDPFYAGFFSTNNTPQWIDIAPDVVINMGRTSDTTGFDAWCVSANSIPNMRVSIPSNGSSVNDVPTNTCVLPQVSGVGIGGRFRNGIDAPYTEMFHRIRTSGTVTVSNVTADADTTGFVRFLTNAPAIKLVGTGKVYINYPVVGGRTLAHCWSFHTNPVNLTGTVTIKERNRNFSFGFDGTSVTAVADNRGPAYEPSTITVAAGANGWTRRSWKGTRTSYPQMLNTAESGMIVLEIDLSAMTAGSLYLSGFCYDYQ